MSRVTDDLTTTCPRCGGTEFYLVDCGPDGWDDDITYTSEVCRKCELWYDGWNGKWYVDVTSWQDIEFADEFVPAPNGNEA